MKELIVDNFAGGGGASTGIEMALGRPVDIAINHDPEAIAMHAANHPQTEHLCEDVFKVDPIKATKGQPVGFAWFSPDCKDFSKAKGGKPRSKKIRALAWVMVKWAALKRPRVMVLENVEEFQGWGPLLSDGRRCPERKGRTFRNFVARLRNLGYRVEWKELRACDYSRAPTIRKRLFLIARCDGQPIVWPLVVYGRRKSSEVVAGKLKPYHTAAECIDWSMPCRSIFERKRPLAEATLRRIARGIRKFVVETDDPFILRVAHGEVSPAGVKRWGAGVHPIDEPIGTISASGEFALASAHLTKFRTGATGSSINDPVPTITAGPKENPAGAAHAMGLVSATLIQSGYGERKGQSPRVPGLDKPLGTVVAEGQKHGLVSAFLAKHYGGHETPGTAVQKPFDTVTAKDHHAVVATHLVRHFGKSIGSLPTDPVGTIPAGGMGKTGLISSHLSKLYGTTIGHDAREPLHTITSGGNHIAEVRAFLIKYYGAGGQDQDLRDPMHTIPSRDRIGLVTVAGEQYVITDIGMRMLEPHELFAAQGFPGNYVIAPEMVVQRGRKLIKRRLPKHAQVRMCGNSVPPPMAEVITALNVPELSERAAREVAA